MRVAQDKSSAEWFKIIEEFYLKGATEESERLMENIMENEKDLFESYDER